MKGSFTPSGASAMYDSEGNHIAEEIRKLKEATPGSYNNIGTTDKPGILMPDGKTITVEENGKIHAVLFRDWKSVCNYDIDDYVIYNSQIYRCIRTHISSVFTDDISYWVLISGALNCTGRIVGDGVQTEFTISHGLNSSFIFCRLYDSDDDICFTNVKVKDANTIIVKFDTAPEVGETYTFIIDK